ncbi:MAG: cell division protein ZapE [Firmicutes bacterium]|nr:cell division protein ZapE [Bacillota bacterium]
MDSIKSFSKESLNKELIKEYKENLKDEIFKNLVNTLKIDENIGSLNTSTLMDSVCELKNCSKCKGLYECANKVTGHYLYPKKDGNIIDIGYVACKYKKENDKLLELRNTASKELLNARFKDIDITDKNRVKLIKWLKEFYDNYDGIKDMKGLYLHGVFGSGKTYLVYALLNELKINKKVDFEAIYYPEVLKKLKEDWDTYNSKIERYSNVPILLLDDIGAEQVSEWGRDEVLGTILQNRMNNHLTTFFTSNLTIDELEYHLSLTKSSIDKVKARRIIERIKQLTIDLELITDNKRK